MRDEDVIKPQPKPVSSSSNQSKAKPSKSAPVSGVKKFIPPPKLKATVSMSGVEKGKKKKPSRPYVAVEEDTELDEEIRKVKNTATYTQVVRKPSDDAPLSKKTKTQAEPFRRSRETKRQQSKIDEALESGKVEFIPPKSLEDIRNKIIKDGNLNNLAIYYKNADYKEWQKFEEAIVQYMNNFSRALIELSFELPKELYDILDIQRNTSC